MPEFNRWLASEPGSNDSFIWIRGPGGVGKSVMAAYFIQHIKATFPDAIVAYFFCKSGPAGSLTDTRTLIRTLAYQFLKASDAAHDSLKKLKAAHFQPSGTVDINFMFDRLCQDTLDCVSQDIYIVLDGLDEADMAVRNDRDRYPEVRPLIRCFGGLKRPRMLFIGRPELDISELVPQPIIKSITKQDNGADIHTYVEREWSQSKTFGKWYPEELPDPIAYFVHNSHGLFLWVFTILQQLSTVKTKLQFQGYVELFTKSFGDMDTLYRGILERFDPVDRVWVREILQ